MQCLNVTNSDICICFHSLDIVHRKQQEVFLKGSLRTGAEQLGEPDSLQLGDPIRSTRFMALLTECILIFPLIPNFRRLRGKHLQAQFGARAHILTMCCSLTDLKGCHGAFVSSKVKRKNPSAVNFFPSGEYLHKNLSGQRKK